MNLIKVILFILLVIGDLKAQIVNSEFDNWVTIDTSGQPYEDLLNWETNNEGLGNGFATTPNIRIVEGNDIGVSLTTGYNGIDGSYSGIISQIINTDKLLNIEYLSKCDSIFERGACIVNIYDETEALIFTDSLKLKESEYSIKNIDISDLSNLQSETIRIEFSAFGQIGAFEPFQAYSEFNLLKVDANYITSTYSQLSSQITLVPNPFSDQITIQENFNSKMQFHLFDSSGQLITKGNKYKIDTRTLDSGVYLIQIHLENEIITKRMIKH